MSSFDGAKVWPSFYLAPYESLSDKTVRMLFPSRPVQNKITFDVTSTVNVTTTAHVAFFFAVSLIFLQGVSDMHLSLPRLEHVDIRCVNHKVDLQNFNMVSTLTEHAEPCLETYHD